MKTLNRSVIVAGVTLATLLGAGQLAAQQGQGGQGRGNFDPEQMRQRMMDNVRERFEIKSDDEWKVIEPRVQKVMEARRDVGFGGGMGMFGPGGRRRGGQGGDGNNQADNNNNNNNRRPRFGGEPSPEAQDLQKAIDANASKDVIEAKLAKFRESRKKKQAQLEQTQEELRKVLTVKQEASAVLMGLLQ